MLRLRWPAVVVALSIIALALIASVEQARPALAHAVLERSNPSQAQQLQTPPELVDTFFSEPLERSLTKLAVLDTQGNSVHTGDTQFSETDPNQASIAIPPGLPPGVYTVTYQNVSTVDGHSWTGFFSFIVLNEDGTVPEGDVPEGLGGGGQGLLPELGDSIFRWFALVAAVVLGGGAAFYLFVAGPAAAFLDEERRTRVQEAAATVIGDLALAAAPVLLIAGLAQLGLLADRIGGPATLDDILFNTRSGAIWIARQGLVVLLLITIAPLLVSRAWRTGARATVISALALVLSASILMMFSLVAHAGVGGGAFWAITSDFVHFAATAAWIGGLVQLVLMFWWTRQRLDEPDRILYQANVLDRFSWVAVVSVTLIMGTGIFNGFVQLPTLESLWDTNYGRVLIAKLTLILPMLGVAGINAWYLKPRLVAATDTLYGETGAAASPGDARTLERLRAALPRTTAVEFLIGIAVLVTVSILVQSTTAEGELRVAAAQPQEDFVATRQRDDFDIELTISPFAVGLSDFTVKLEPKGDTQIEDLLRVELRSTFDDPNAPLTAGQGFTSQVLDATEEPGVFSASSALLTQAGDWSIRMRIRQRGVDDLEVTFPVPNVGGGAPDEPEGLFDLPFTFVDWNIVAGGAFVAFGLGLFLIWLNRPDSWQRGTSNSTFMCSAAGMIAGAVLLFGVDVHGPEVSPKNPIPPTEASVNEGAELFALNCMVCHGADGRGGGVNNAADLTVHVPVHSEGTIFIWITKGLPLEAPEDERRMPSFQDALTDEQRWHLVNYLKVTFGGGDFTPVRPDNSTPAP